MIIKSIFLIILSINILHSSNIVIKDQGGKETILKESAKRVLIFPMPFSSMYIAIDNGTHNIAGVHGDTKNVKKTFIADAYPSVSELNTELVQSGFVPNIEQVISLKPDVIFQWTDQGEHLIEPMRKIGLPVIGVKYGTQEYLEEWIDFMGKTTGNIEKANEIIKWQNDIKLKIVEKNTHNTNKPKIMSLHQSKDRNRVAGQGSYDDFIINLIGGINPARNDIQRFADISKEQLLKYNPDIVILGTFDTQTPEEFMKQEMYQNMNAVKNKQVYKLPFGGYRWGIPHIEAPLTWLWLYKLTYDDKEIDFKENMKDTYKFLYNYEINNEEIEKILNPNLHKNTKNYNLLLD